MSIHAEFFAAVQHSDLEAVRALLQADPALVSARDADGATALHHAAFEHRRELITILLEAGADINARDTVYGATPAGWAIHFLRERGALLAVEIEDLLFAIRRNDTEWAERFLVRHPSLARARDHAGKPMAEHASAADPSIARLFDRSSP